jgi:hypothetical protein
MATFLIVFYIIGVILSFLAYFSAARSQSDISLTDFLFIIIISLFSWLAIIAGFVNYFIDRCKDIIIFKQND